MENAERANEKKSKMQNMKKMRKFAPVILVVIAIGIILTVSGLISNSSASDPALFEIQSFVEMDETSIAAQFSGEVKEVYVEVGERVTKGQLIAIIDDESLLIKKSQAEANIEAIQGQIDTASANETGAAAQLMKVQEGARPEELIQVKAQYEQAEANFQRMSTLYQEGAISYANYESALANRDILKAQYDIAANGARSSDVLSAQSSVHAAAGSVEALGGQLKSVQSSLAEIELQLSKTKIFANRDGIVSQLGVKQGELISAGAKAAVVLDDSIPFLQCNVKETDISKVQLGQKVAISFGAYDDQNVNGTVTWINRDADYATKRATNENGSFDVRSYKVKVELEDTDIPLYVGMTAFAAFLEE